MISNSVKVFDFNQLHDLRLFAEATQKILLHLKKVLIFR